MKTLTCILFLFQLGIVSYGKGCAEKNYPGIYTIPIDYMNWIRNNMACGKCD